MPLNIAGTRVPQTSAAVRRPAWKKHILHSAISMGMLSVPSGFAFAEETPVQDEKRNGQQARVKIDTTLSRTIDVDQAEVIDHTGKTYEDRIRFQVNEGKPLHILGGTYHLAEEGNPAIQVNNGVRGLMTGGEVVTTASTSDGIRIAPDANMTFDGVSVSTSGADSHGITHLELAAPGGGVVPDVTLKNVRVDTKGEASQGVRADGGYKLSPTPTLVTIDGTTITTAGTNSTGAFIGDNNRAFVKSSTIQTEGKLAAAAHVDGGVGLDIEKSKLETKGAYSAALIAQRTTVSAVDSTIATAGEGSTGIIMADSTVALENTTVHASGDSSAAVASGGGRFEAIGSTLTSDKGAAFLVAHPEHTPETQAPADDTARPGDRSTSIRMARNAVAKGGNGVLLDVMGHADADKVTNVDLKVEENSSAYGDIVSRNAAVPNTRINVALDGASQWQGGTRIVNNLALSNDSRWTMDKDSSVGALQMNGGTVVFDHATNAGPTTLDVREGLTGTGTFVMQTDLAAGQGDRLRVAGTAEGSHKILVRNTGAEPAAGATPVQLVQTGGGNAAFSLANKGEVVEAGVYQYKLTQDAQAGQGAAGWSLVQQPTLSSTAKAVATTTDVGTTANMWHVELGIVNQRLNVLRWGEGKNGAWVRGASGRQNMVSGIGLNFRQNFNALEYGYDHAVQLDKGRLHFGALTGTNRTSRSFMDGSSGASTGYHVGLYSALQMDSGTYVTGVITTGKYDHEFNVRGSDGKRVSGSFTNRGNGASLEAGHRFGGQQGWFAEPFAGVDYFRLGGSNFRTDNGMKVRSAGGHSLQLHAGTRIGNAIELTNGNVVSPYAKFGWTQKLASNTKLSMNEVASNMNASGGNFGAGLGFEATLGKRHHVQVGYEYKKGKNFEQPWGVQLGYRYTW